MGRLFEDRERAAEGIFAHDEEARFVARRRGLAALGAWASETMELDATSRVAYADRLVDAFVSGIAEDEIVAAVQTDLERAGKPALSGQAGIVLSQAIAEATAAAHPPREGASREPSSRDRHDALLSQLRKPTSGWML